MTSLEAGVTSDMVHRHTDARENHDVAVNRAAGCGIHARRRAARHAANPIPRCLTPRFRYISAVIGK